MKNSNDRGERGTRKPRGALGEVGQNECRCLREQWPTTRITKVNQVDADGELGFLGK